MNKKSERRLIVLAKHKIYLVKFKLKLKNYFIPARANDEENSKRKRLKILSEKTYICSTQNNQK